MTDDQLKSMQGVAELVPAFKEFGREVNEHLEEAMRCIARLENCETWVQAEMYRARAASAIDRAKKTFQRTGV